MAVERPQFYTPHMLLTETMGWDQARADAAPIRFAVFVEDAACLHAIARSEGRPVGTGRLLPDGHIGRMAVLKAWRGQGVGAAMLTVLIDAARARGDRAVALSAQTHALGFYRRFGFINEGPEYIEAGIPHQAMRRVF